MGQERVFRANEHNYSQKPMEHIFNMLAPSRLTTDTLTIPSGSVASAGTQFQTLNSDPLFLFHTYSIFTPIPIFFSLSDPTDLDTENGRRHFFEGGRWTATTTSPLEAIYVKPASPSGPSVETKIYIVVG